MRCVHVIPILALALLALAAAGLGVPPAGAQEPASLRVIVRDATAQPQPGITIVVDAGDGRGAVPYVTDATGATPRILAPTSLVTITQVLDSDRTPLAFELTSLEGVLVIPLRGHLDLPWAYDRASRSVISLPRTMRNEAFPELEVLPAEADGQRPAAADGPRPTGAGPAPAGAPPAPPPAGGPGWFWIILAGLLLSGAGLSLVVWAQARAARTRRAAPRPPGRR